MKAFKLKIGKKFYKFPYNKFIERFLEKNKENDYIIKCFTNDKKFFYEMFYVFLGGVSTIADITDILYPEDEYVRNELYRPHNPYDIINVILAYNKEINKIIKYVRENEDYVSDLIQKL